MKTTLIAAVLACATAAYAQAPGTDGHSAHHPAGPAAPREEGASSTRADKFTQQMMRMQQMHERMSAAKTPAARQALMQEQMALMQSGMDMMKEMHSGGMGGMGMGAMDMSGMMGAPHGQQSPGSQQTPPSTGGMMGGGGMMNMHATMERRMAMMEAMMQMMLDRESARSGQ